MVARASPSVSTARRLSGAATLSAISSKRSSVPLMLRQRSTAPAGHDHRIRTSAVAWQRRRWRARSSDERLCGGRPGAPTCEGSAHRPRPSVLTRSGVLLTLWGHRARREAGAPVLGTRPGCQWDLGLRDPGPGAPGRADASCGRAAAALSPVPPLEWPPEVPVASATTLGRLVRLHPHRARSRSGVRVATVAVSRVPSRKKSDACRM